MAGGRPTVRTDEVNRKIEECASLGASIEEIAFYAGIHRDTLYDWMKKDSELSDRIRELQERPVLKARQTVVKSLENPVTAQWYLERKKKNEFAQRSEHTGADGKDLEVAATPELVAVTKILNEFYRGTSFPSNGGTPSPVGIEAPDKE